MVKIGILGTTTWGTTLGLIASWRSIDVSQWARTDHEAREITSKGFNPRLPDVSYLRTLTLPQIRMRPLLRLI